MTITNVFSIIKALALLTYAGMIVFTWFADPNKSRDFFDDHKVFRNIIGALAILGAILFIVDVFAGKVV